MHTGVLISALLVCVTVVSSQIFGPECADADAVKVNGECQVVCGKIKCKLGDEVCGPPDAHDTPHCMPNPCKNHKCPGQFCVIRDYQATCVAF